MLRYLLIALILIGLTIFGYFQYRDMQESGFVSLGEFPVDGNAEIIQAAGDGNYLIHTNSENSSIDVIDISTPTTPKTVASINVPGEPTSVGVSPDGEWAFAVVYASISKEGKKPLDPRLPGVLVLIDLRELPQATVATMAGIGHHPDSIAVTRAGNELLAIIAIENEPLIVVDGKVIDDETPGHEADISLAGSIQIVAINPEQPNRHTVTTVALDKELLHNAEMLFSGDPQPEYVALSPGKHLAAVSLQENNGIVLIDPAAGEIVGRFSLGTVTDRPADLLDNNLVELKQMYPSDAVSQPLAGSRFPDAISFTPDGQYILSADEGELPLTGGRGFSVWSLDGKFVWDDGGEIERKAAELQLYPDKRSDVRGIEVEGITAARFGDRDYAFALSERGSFVAIYDITNPQGPVFVEIIPVGTAPESVVAIPGRDLIVVASEKSGSITLIRHVASPTD